MKGLCCIVWALWSAHLWPINEELGPTAFVSSVTRDWGMTPLFYEDLVRFGIIPTDTDDTLETFGEIFPPQQEITAHPRSDTAMEPAFAAIEPVASMLSVPASDGVFDYRENESSVNLCQRTGRRRKLHASPRGLESRKKNAKYLQARETLKSLKYNPTHGHFHSAYITLVKQAKISPEAQDAQTALEQLRAERKIILSSGARKNLLPELKQQLVQIRKEINKYKQKKYRALYPSGQIVALYNTYLESR